MNIRCPICNSEMMELPAPSSPSKEYEKLFSCINDDCIVKPRLPSNFTSPAANAMANVIIQLGDQANAISKKVYTKKREGRMGGLQYGAQLVARAMGAVGYSIRKKDGQ